MRYFFSFLLLMALQIQTGAQSKWQVLRTANEPVLAHRLKPSQIFLRLSLLLL